MGMCVANEARGAARAGAATRGAATRAAAATPTSRRWRTGAAAVPRGMTTAAAGAAGLALAAYRLGFTLTRLPPRFPQLHMALFLITVRCWFAFYLDET